MTTEKLFTGKGNLALFALLSCLLWGSAFPFIKIGYRLFEVEASDTFSQILFAGIRFFLAGVLTVLIGSLAGRKMLKVKKENRGRVAILCLFQTILQYTFFYIGLANTTGVKSSIIESMSTFAAILMSAAVFRMEKLSMNKLLGCLIGFAGVVLVNLNGAEGETFSFHLMGEGMVLLSTISYAASTVFAKRFSKYENPVALSGYQFILGGLLMIIAALSGHGHLMMHSAAGWLVLLWLSMVSALAYTFWSLLLKYNPVSSVTIYGFSTPVFGVLLSALLLKESTGISVFTIIALVLVSLGIWIVNRRQ